MKVRRTKPYVCVDVDYADHYRFQATTDVDAAAGTWLRCLAHSRAQEQDGVVTAGWLRRTFATTYERVEELLKVGLLRRRPEGDYEIHAYAPRNQTREMVAEERSATRERVRQWRRSGSPPPKPSDVTPYERVTSVDVTIDDRTSLPADSGSSSTHETGNSHETSSEEARAALGPSDSALSLTQIPRLETREKFIEHEELAAKHELPTSESVTPYKRVTSDVVTEYENACNAFVPTSTSTSSSLCSSFSSSGDFSGDDVSAVPRASVHAERSHLPASERSLWGSLWLTAFTEGIGEGTGRPCTAGRFYVGTLERIVAHHAPDRDAPRACAWLKAQAKAFAAQWDGKHPAKGLTPDGLERWLNEGRQGPPDFGRSRIVQLPAEEWHEDDWSDLGATVDR